MSCLFCRIVQGDIPCRRVYEDEHMLVFHDINPAAEVHVLAIPKEHVDNLFDVDTRFQSILGHMMIRLGTIARELGLEQGFKVRINNGIQGGQEVFHLHLHLLGQRCAQSQES